MKDGSGDLDFGSDDEEDDEDHSDATDSQSTRETSDQEPTTHPVDDTTRDKAGAQEETARVGRPSSTPRQSSRQEEYPYFVRRNNVTDERSRRLECHVRPEVAQRESDFRSRVAAALGTDSVSKTDAREFALKFAFENPDKVAELMREEGFDVVR
jgi:hypothetical protein